MKRIFELLKKLIKKKSFWLILVIAIIVLVFIINKISGPKVEYTLETVKKGDLVQTVSETGTMESASAINLNFKGAGTLVEVRVKEGDGVKAGELLARLDAGTLEIAVRQARANYDMAQANLDKLLAGASLEDLKVSEEIVNNAKIAADNAQSNFDNIQNQSTKSISDARQNLTNEIDKQIAACRAALDAIKIIFDNKDLDYQYSVKNPQYGIDSHNYYDEALLRLVNAETSINNLKASDTDVNLAEAVIKLRDVQSWIKNALDNTYLGLINTLVGNYYTEADNNTDKTIITNQQSIINAGIASLDATNQNYSNSKLNQDSNYTQAKASLDSALGAYNLAKAQYELKKALPRAVDIASYQAQVDQARAAYDLALKNLDDYIIYAPTDGVITFVNYKKGEQVSVGVSIQPVIAMMGVGDFQIEVDVPESNIIKIKVSNEVNVTLDAYGSDIIFKGKVVSIDVAETVIQGVIYYKTTVYLDETDKELKSGMTANVDIITGTVVAALYLPNRAIKQDDEGKRYVEILKLGATAERIDIETGIKADIGTEIKSGLQEGQEVIVSKRQK